jgi:hypothetical protein
MGAPTSRIQAAEQPSAEGLLTAFKTIDEAERKRHAQVLGYWMSIRGDKEFPPLHDLDPLEISDAGPSSVLLELLSGGHDAEIRHLGEALRVEGWPEQIMDAANPSVLASIAKKLPIVAISRDFLAFEDEYSTEAGTTRCWVTLLPLSGGGAWVDYVYALVTLDTQPAKGAEAPEKPAKRAEPKAPEPQAAEVVEDAAVEEPSPRSWSWWKKRSSRLPRSPKSWSPHRRPKSQSRKKSRSRKQSLRRSPRRPPASPSCSTALPA